MTENYEGLLHVPATDPNFLSGIGRLDNCDLAAMLERMGMLEGQGEHHKGRIKAVESELASRAEPVPKRGRKAKTGGNSREIAAMDKFQADIETAERLYADGMPYELDRIENEIRFFQDQAGQSFIEMGKRFIRIKAHEDHGRFMRALENVGISQRGADYAMAAARKFSNSQTFANLGQSKQIVLTVLDDDSIQTLEDGGEVKGVTLDDIDKMSVRELKETLRSERDGRKSDRKSTDKAIFMKEKKIGELEAQLRWQELPTKEQLAGAKLDEYLQPFNAQLHDAIFAMNRCIDMITEAQRIEAVGYAQLNDFVLKHTEGIAMITEAFGELQGAINDIHIDRIEESEKAADSAFSIID